MGSVEYSPLLKELIVMKCEHSFFLLSGIMMKYQLFLKLLRIETGNQRKWILPPLLLLVFLVMSLLSGCKNDKVHIYSGKTMGTYWRVTVATPVKSGQPDPASEIRTILSEINGSMSLFDRSSELSVFNSMTPSDDPKCVSDRFYRVYTTGTELYRLTGGAWDGTIGPLVNMWGFGNKGRKTVPPDEKTISDVMASTGYDHIINNADRCLSKDVHGLILDFGSIAKGFAVDEVAAFLRKSGYGDCLVEIGGEVYASGTKFGKPWKIGVNTPSHDASPTQVYKVLSLKDKAIATSGDYRNFREIDGSLYSHVINPETGKPVRNNVASVSVMADTTVFADGLATALMVMGHKAGVELVDSINGVECLIVLRESDGSFSEYMSRNWNKHEQAMTGKSR